MYLRESKKSPLMYSLAFSILAGSLGRSFRNISITASSLCLVGSRSMVASMAGSVFQTQTLVLPISHSFSRMSLVILSFFLTTLLPDSSEMVSATSLPLTSSSTRSICSSTAPKSLRISSLFSTPKAFKSTVTGSFFRLSMFTDSTSPGVMSNSSHAPLSGMTLAA